MRALAFFGLIVLLFASCGKEEKIVFIKFDDSEGIKTKDHVLLNGVSVGTILDIDIAKDYKVITKVRLSDSLDFPKDTQFEIQSQDVFTKVIVVTLGKWETNFKTGDTIQGISWSEDRRQNSHDKKPPKLLNDLKEMLKN